MRFLSIPRVLTALATVASLSMLATAADAAAKKEAETIYAQQLVEKVMQRDAALRDVIFHVTPVDSTQNMAIAAYTTGERGKPSGADDVGVMETRKPLVEVQKDGVRIGVLIPLMDKRHEVVGTLGLMYSYAAGQDEHAFLQRSEVIRNQLAKEISSRAALFVKK